MSFVCGLAASTRHRLKETVARKLNDVTRAVDMDHGLESAQDVASRVYHLPWGPDELRTTWLAVWRPRKDSLALDLRRDGRDIDDTSLRRAAQLAALCKALRQDPAEVEQLKFKAEEAGDAAVGTVRATAAAVRQTRDWSALLAQASGCRTGSTAQLACVDEIRALILESVGQSPSLQQHMEWNNILAQVRRLHFDVQRQLAADVAAVSAKISDFEKHAEAVLAAHVAAVPCDARSGSLKLLVDLSEQLVRQPARSATVEDELRRRVRSAVADAASITQAVVDAIKGRKAAGRADVLAALEVARWAGAGAMKYADAASGLGADAWAAGAKLEGYVNAALRELAAATEANVTATAIRSGPVGADDVLARVTYAAAVVGQLRGLEPRSAVADQVAGGIAATVTSVANTLCDELQASTDTIAAAGTSKQRRFESVMLVLDRLATALDPDLSAAAGAIRARRAAVLEALSTKQADALAVSGQQAGADPAAYARALTQHLAVSDSMPSLNQTMRNLLDQELDGTLPRLTKGQVRAVVRELRALGPRGSPVLASSMFASVTREAFNLVAGKISPKIAVESKLECDPHLQPGQETLLIERLELLINAQRPALLRKAFDARQAYDFEHSVNALRDDVFSKAEEARNTMQTSDLLELVGLVAFLHTWMTTGEKFDGAEANVLLLPHSIQLSSVLRFLGLEKSAARSTAIINLKMAMQGSGAFGDNHVIEIKTGEGKSIALGVLAAVLSVLGFPVDVVCYSRLLTMRDSAELRALHEKLGCDVRYLTFQDVMEKRVAGLREAVLKTAKGEAIASPPPPTLASASTRRVLLLDEIDVLFSEDFYGAVFTPVARLVTPAIRALLQFVYDEKRNDTALRAIEKHDCYKAVAGELPALATSGLLSAQVKLMVEQVADFGVRTQLHDPTRPRNYLVDRIKGIGYFDSDGTVNWTFAKDGWYHAAFALLHEMGQKATDAEDREQRLSIPLQCPELLYTNLVDSCYFAFFGVSGTLRTIPKGMNDLLTTLCKVTAKTYTQSVYPPTGQLSLPEDKVLCAAGGSEAAAEEEWLVTLYRLMVQIVTAGAHTGGDGNFPCVLVFENSRRIEQFRARFATEALVSECFVIDRNTPAEQVAGLVSTATKGCNVTLVDRIYGRGTDFRSDQCTKLTVVQTFLAIEESEETQIRGRTGRQGQPGRWCLVLNPYHVAAALGGDEGANAEPAALEALFKPQDDFVFSDLRIAAVNKQLQSRAARCATFSSTREADAASFVQELLGSTQSPVSKWRRVLQYNTGALPQHFVFILDASGSMTGQNWQSLQAATRGALTNVKASRPSSTMITVVLFGSRGSSKVHVCQNAGTVRVDCLEGVVPDMGTDYREAFRVTATALQAQPRNEFVEVNVLFMTDGADLGSGGVALAAEVRRLCEVAHVVSYRYILFAGATDNTSTQTINEAFAQGGVAAVKSQASDAAALSAAFSSFVAVKGGR